MIATGQILQDFTDIVESVNTLYGRIPLQGDDGRPGERSEFKVTAQNGSEIKVRVSWGSDSSYKYADLPLHRMELAFHDKDGYVEITLDSHISNGEIKLTPSEHYDEPKYSCAYDTPRERKYEYGSNRELEQRIAENLPFIKQAITEYAEDIVQKGEFCHKIEEISPQIIVRDGLIDWAQNHEIEHYDVPSDIEGLGHFSFHCRNLKSVTIPAYPHLIQQSI